MAKQTTKLAASVHKRLLNLAQAAGRPFNELLQHYAIERLIYRLAASPHRDGTTDQPSRPICPL